MKLSKKIILSVFLLVTCLSLCACAVVEQRNILPEAPSFVSDAAEPIQPAEELSARGLSYDELTGLSRRTWLKKLVTDGSTEYDAFLYLRSVLPECDIHWTYELNGQTYDDSITELSVDTTDGLMEALHCLPDVKTVDMTSFTPDTEALDSLIAAYPQVQFLFYVHFGEWTVRSDITCFSTLRPSKVYEADRYTSADLYPLFKYCKHLRALDCGHNYLDDLTELGTLTELQVLILADNREITDISPLGNLVNLEYLELFLNSHTFDYTVFNKLTKMKDLDLCYLHGLKDISFIDNMPDLEMFWLRGTAVPSAMVKEYMAKYPNVKFHYTCSFTSSTCHGWRTSEDNLAVRKALRNWWSVNEFRSMDDVEYDPYDELVIPEPSLY